MLMIRSTDTDCAVIATGAVMEKAAPGAPFPAADAVPFLVGRRHEHYFVPSSAGPDHTDRNN